MAVACLALGAFGSACNALSGVDELHVGVGAEAGGPEGSADRTRAGSSGGEAAAVDQGMDATGDATVEATVETGDGAVDAGSEAGNDAESDSGSDAENDAASDVAADAPLDTGSEAIADAASDTTSEAAADAGDGGSPGDAEGGGADGCAVGTPVCEAGCPTMHSDGLGQSFYDCVPLNTYTLTEALAACAAFTGHQDACANDPITCAAGDQVCSSGYSLCACWRYFGPNAGKVGGATPTCACPGSGAVSWH